MKNVFVFIPDKLKFNKNGYLQGFYRKFYDSEAYFVVNNGITKTINTPDLIGYVDNEFEKNWINNQKALHINQKTKKITLLNTDFVGNIVEIYYDLKTFTDSKVIPTGHGVHFETLINYLRDKQNNHRRKPLYINAMMYIAFIITVILRYLEKVEMIITRSATLSHFYNNLRNFKWFLNELSIERKLFSPSIGNILISKIIDFIIGLILLKFMLDHQELIVEIIGETREIIIDNLRQLLTYLMGSPIGLKLNKAFNNCLGTFFFYHLSLWRIFLHTMQPLLRQYFRFIAMLGVLGFSYQVALFSDLISAATFHLYCIYIYATRLFNLQLTSILSLFRLFIGRKYNPLRDRIDSFQYSPQQLFIGTLGFTILFFLLPSTLLYYTVFTSFRISIILCNIILTKIRIFFDNLPFYIVILWLSNSSELDGTVQLKWKSARDTLALEANLKLLPLNRTIEEFLQPKNDQINGKNRYNITIKNLLTGVSI